MSLSIFIAVAVMSYLSIIAPVRKAARAKRQREFRRDLAYFRLKAVRENYPRLKNSELNYSEIIKRYHIRDSYDNLTLR